MALIKSTSANTLTKNAVVLDFGDLQRQGQEILRAAKANAQQIIEQARAEREELIHGASAEGRAQGIAVGLEQGRAEGREQAAATALAESQARIDNLEQTWVTVLSEFAAQRDALIHAATKDVAQLATEIASRVIKRAVAVDPAIIADQVAAALAVVVRPTEVLLLIHPADRDFVSRALPALLSALPVIRHVDLVDDASIERGGCILRTRGDRSAGDAGGGEVDARLQTQISRIVDAIIPASQDVRPGEQSW